MKQEIAGWGHQREEEVSRNPAPAPTNLLKPRACSSLPGMGGPRLTGGPPSVTSNAKRRGRGADSVERVGGQERESQLPELTSPTTTRLSFLPSPPALPESLAAHTDVAGLAAGVFLGVSS